MDLDNAFKVVVYHLLIGGMIGFDYQDKFYMVSALMCVVTRWKKLTMSYDVSVDPQFCPLTLAFILYVSHAPNFFRMAPPWSPFGLDRFLSLV